MPIARFAPAVAVGLGATFVITGLLVLEVVSGLAYTLAVGGAGLAVAAMAAAFTRGKRLEFPWIRTRVDPLDLAAIATLYAVVVGGFLLAFTVFTIGNVLGLFLSFGAAMLVGSVGPVVYTVWIRQRPLSALGIGLGNWRLTAALALVFAGVQFALTLARIDYPSLQTWLPLLVMALVVGLFESIFFRGFIQNRLEEAFGLVPAIAIAAGLYGLYHVGYGMGWTEIGFLAGLGIVYAVAFRVAGSIVVLWPLLTPLGSLFNQLQAGDIVLPMESIIGFADVLALMAVALWLARRHERRRAGTGALPELRGAHP
jgi:membrane protease YdiL (CAAX protease family)